MVTKFPRTKSNHELAAASNVSMPTTGPRTAWLRWLTAALAGLLLAAVFSGEISNSDFWWHLKTGQYLCETRTLPSPDPFAYTTAGAGQAYPGEETTRRFNLTHEWFAQVLLYSTYKMAGWSGIVLGRTFLLVVFCGLVGAIVYRRCGGFYRSVAATLAAGSVVYPFAVDRPFLLTFVFLAGVTAILEWRRPVLWYLLPVVMLVWANAHGGFILGWAVLGAYAVESFRSPQRVRLWTICAISVAISGLNPNGFRVVQVLASYRQSPLTAGLIEWGHPAFWPPAPFSVLLVLMVVVLAWAGRRARLVDWLLAIAFGGAAIMAMRNTALIGLVAPIVIATYLPWDKVRMRLGIELAAAALLVAGVGLAFAGGQSFQLHSAEWQYPSGAAEFLLANHITGRVFNSYEYGGYLMWKLWPFQRVFIDGRALSESVFSDYRNALYCTEDRECQGASRILDRYGVEVVVMNTFEYTSGQAYVLAPALGDPGNLGWKLVYADAQAIVLLRHPPDGMAVLDPSHMLSAMEAECTLHIQHEPQFPGCARNLGQMYSNMGDFGSARRWLGLYLEHAPVPDPEASTAYQKMVQSGQ